MHGTNPKRPPIKDHDGQNLDVVEIFSTIQGEGPFAGVPAIFIRLGGCNLACDFCDTEFEDFQAMTLEEVVQMVNSSLHKGVQKSPTPLAGNTNIKSPRLRGDSGGNISTTQMFEGFPPAPPASGGDKALRAAAHGKNKTKYLVVITGGEPLRHNLSPLCHALIEQGYCVQIETNGTLYQPLPEAVHIVCSPKNTGNGYAPLRPDMLARADALKFIISKTHPHYQHIPDWCDAVHAPIYLQPMDEQNDAKNQANRHYAAELAMQRSCRLSLQLHKILGMP